ncbi:MAG TPA: hypothetical protein DCS93_07505 [Microscillaceae bacterium]|nr:hypothetical protein [Microscillaceae bacterium]
MSQLVQPNQAKGQLQQDQPQSNAIQRKSSKYKAKQQPIQAKQTPIKAKQQAIQAKQKPIQAKTKPVSKSNSGGQGLPNSMKNNMETLGGVDLSDVKVHHNSGEPQKVGALAYAQGTDIHLAPGQEKHLGHEAWHTVQQKQGRVKPTTVQGKGFAVNDDPQLEKEADVMGEKATQMKAKPESVTNQTKTTDVTNTQPAQMQVAQMKMHKLNDAAESSWFDFDGDSSAFEVDPYLNIHEYGEGWTWENIYLNHNRFWDMEVYDYEDQEIDYTRGAFSIDSEVWSLIDQSRGNNMQDSSDMSTNFTYERGADNQVKVKLASDKEEKKWTYGGDKQYYYIKKAKVNGDLITQDITFGTNVKEVDESSTSTTESERGFDIDLASDINPGIDSSVKLHLEADGEDILMMLAGTKLFKGSYKALNKFLKKYPALNKVLSWDKIAELFAKQELKIDLNPSLKAELETHFGVKFKRSTSKSHTKNEKSKYTVGGALATERSKILVNQMEKKKPEPPQKEEKKKEEKEKEPTPKQEPKKEKAPKLKGTAAFYQKDSAELTKEHKAAIDKWLMANKAHLDGVIEPDPIYQIGLTGHTSRDGSDQYNQELAMKRMVSVLNYIRQKDGFRHLGKTAYYKLVSKGEAEAFQQLEVESDRRVDLCLVKK